MKKKEESKHLGKEWEEMSIHLNSFLETGDQEELHRFRVQVKKIRAMLSLIEDASGEHAFLKNFKPVKKVFKYAGNIRDAHTTLQLAAHYGIKNEAFESGGLKIIEEGIIEFQHKGKKFIKNIKHACRQINDQLPGIDNDGIAEYYDKQLRQIATNLAVAGFTEDMHTNRKLIKTLVYNHKLAEKALPGHFPYNISYLDKLQDTIGKWHDNIVAAQLFLSPELNDKPIAAKIRRKNAAIKRNITLLTEDFLNKATTVEEAEKTN
jgi:CHAD domain-containing protein